jgi:hypothetical protein
MGWKLKFHDRRIEFNRLRRLILPPAALFSEQHLIQISGNAF